MRKFFTIALIFIHLIAYTELSEVFKFPQLITHYFQHNRINPGLDFFKFLAMHYGEGDGTHADDSEDSKLPGQHSNTHGFSFAYTAVIKNFSQPERPPVVGKTVYNSRFLNSHSSKHVQLILQPPRA